MVYARIGKRALDIAVAGSALLALLPLIAALALGARLSSPGPALFRQARVGQGGHLFTLLKFRSMPTGTGDIASDKLEAVAIRPFGQFIRRTNLDELPQLWNILRGDMSIVGPRPALPNQVELLECRRKSGAMAASPGLTGLAQVNSFDGMSIERKAALDAEYAAGISFTRDILIILRTFAYLLRPPPKY